VYRVSRNEDYVFQLLFFPFSRFRNAEGAQDHFRFYMYKGPKMGESRITTRAFNKKITIFPDFGDATSLRILSTFDSRAFRRV